MMGSRWYPTILNVMRSRAMPFIMHRATVVVNLKL